MSDRTKLTLEAERDLDGRLPPLPPNPRGAATHVADAQPALNHVHLLGEAFGEDTSEALRYVDHAYSRLDDLPFPPGVTPFSFFIDDDLPVLLDAWDRVASRLAEAIDEEGKPRGALGARLAAAPWMERHEDGTLWFSGYNFSILDMRERLDELREMFRFALERGLNVRLEVV